MPNVIITERGTGMWYNAAGKLHRLDGPAYVWEDGTKEWWVDGEPFVEKEYPQAVLLYKCRMVLES